MAQSEFPGPDLDDLHEAPDTLTRKEIDGRLGNVASPAFRRVLSECLAGEASPNLALARLLLETGRLELVETALAAVARDWDGPLPEALAELLRLIEEQRSGCEHAAALMRDHPSRPGPGVDPDDVVEATRRFFDHAVQAHGEVSVAAYALGSSELFQAATQEIVDLFKRWGLLGPDRVALEIGCGMGRMQQALSPHLAEVHGVDVSPGMIAAARQRCAGLSNVHLAASSGHDLAGLPSGHFDLVFAVDSFPYIEQAGEELIEAYFEEVDRVLRPGGDFVILNYSYRDDLASDQEDMEALCEDFDFVLEVSGAEPFSVWDGVVFLCRKPGRGE